MIKKIITESVMVKQAILGSEPILDKIALAINEITNRFRNGNRLWLCGNGGSAADAQHIAAEFSGRFYLNRPALPAESFTVNTSYLTAVANDYSFEDIYSRMVQAMAREGDVLIGLSTSGNSANVVKAIQAAKDAGVYTIALTGESGGTLLHDADLCICVPSHVTPRIQEAHIMIGHIICELVESALFGKDIKK